MPNWHTNAIAMHKDNLSLFLNDEDELDFEKICPMPKSLNIVSGTIQKQAIESLLYDSEEKYNAAHNFPLHFPYNDIYSELPFPIENFVDLQNLGRVYLDNEKKYGAQTWYDWCRTNWGTKWNATDTEIYSKGDIAVIVFQTPWTSPNIAMFDSILKETEHPAYIVEDYDEDFNGITNWYDGDLHEPCMLASDIEIYQDDDEKYEYTYGIVNINWEKLSDELSYSIDENQKQENVL